MFHRTFNSPDMTQSCCVLFYLIVLSLLFVQCQGRIYDVLFEINNTKGMLFVCALFNRSTIIGNGVKTNILDIVSSHKKCKYSLTKIIYL